MKTFNFLLSISAGFIFLNSCGRNEETTNAVRKNITETVFASGVLVPENQYNLTAQSDGYLIRMNFEEGDIVKTGSLLTLIDNKTYEINKKGTNQLLDIANSNLSPDAPAFKQMEAYLLSASQKMKQDQIQVERYKKLYEANSVSKLEYENALLSLEISSANHTALQENYKLLKQQAEQQFISQKTQTEINKVLQSYNEMKAVIGGKVYSKLKELGDYVRKGEIIAVIGNPNKLFAKLSLDESSISKIRLNQKAVLQLNTDKQSTFNGVVTEVYPAFDKLTQSFYCKVVFTNTPGLQISGTQLQANIITAEVESILVIPRKFLDYGSNVNIKGEGKKKIETGFISDEWVEVKSGIDESTTLIYEKK